MFDIQVVKNHKLNTYITNRMRAEKDAKVAKQQAVKRAEQAACCFAE